MRAMLSRTDVWAYRLPFSLQWIWPVPLLIGVFLAPESPWWLVRQGREEQAKKALLRLTSKSDDTFNADETIAMMKYTNELEKGLSAGTKYRDCFRGVDLRRTEIACLTWLCQAMCGSCIMGWSTVFYEQAGLAATGAFDFTLGQYAFGICGTLCSWFLLNFFGRRTLYLSGLCIQFVLLMLTGFISLGHPTDSNSWAIGSMLLIFTFIYDGTVGPVCYCIVAEMSSTRLKGRTIVLARNLYNIGGLVNNVMTSYMLTVKPTGWGWGANSGFFYGGLCFLCILWTYFRLPEAKGRTYAELDVLFERNVSARMFSTTQVELFDPNDLQVNQEKAQPVVEHQESATGRVVAAAPGTYS